MVKIVSQLDVTLDNYCKKIEYKWMGLRECKRWQERHVFTKIFIYLLSMFCIVAPTSEFVAMCIPLDGWRSKTQNLY
jgi:hypothetical protein